MAHEKVWQKTISYLNQFKLKIPTSSINIGTEIARGNVSGSEPFGAYGKLVSTGAVTNKLIWADGTFIVPPSIGTQVSLISTDAADGVGGVGIRSIELHYLDANLAVQSETVILNGLTAVTTVATNIRFIQCGHMVTYGTSKSAVGTITFYNGANIYNQIDPLEVRCSSSARMIPANKRAIITGIVGSSISGSAVARTLISIGKSKFFGHDYTADSILVPIATIGIQDGSQSYNLPIPLIASTGEIVAMTCTTDKAAIITGDWFGWIENLN